jgi:hypothetical protein
MTMSEPIPIKIIPGPIPEHTTAEPLHQTVPWQFDGTLEFTIEPLNPAAKFDRALGGITFDSPDAPYVQTSLDDHSCVFAADNDVPALTGIPWHYTVWLIEGFARLTDDPTVENDSPPPPL